VVPYQDWERVATEGEKAAYITALLHRVES
jgi:hypothetical protein